MERPNPGRILAVISFLFVLLAIQSAVKPFATAPHAGFVVFGVRTDGLLEAVVARVHAVLMLALAYGIWRLKRYALWLLLAYTPYVLLNMLLFVARYEIHPPGGIPAPLYVAFHVPIALAVPGGAAYLLARRRHELT
jgi:hypothetical protein